jgi:outer membrane lipoprotein-sorting protein
VAVGLYGTPGRSAELRSYYFRAVLEVQQPEEFGDDVLDTIEGWHGGPGLWRWSFGDSEHSEQGSVHITNNEIGVYYDRETNVYFRQPSGTFSPTLISSSFIIGLLPDVDPERYFEHWPERETTPGGQVAGRETDKVTVHTSGATTSIWLDRELPFVLKYESMSAGSPQSLVRVEIVEIELNEPVDADVFVFDPPPGAREVEPPGSSVSSSGSSSSSFDGGVTAPEGFLAPAYLPPGYVVTREEGSHAGILGDRLTRYLVLLESGDSYIEVEEQFRAGGLAESQKTGEATGIAGEPAYLQVDGEVTRLVWNRGDIVITLSANALDSSELLRIAESMR